ncbi:MAG TPA: hypothetical protein VFM38_13545 [Candidatus Limnocylindrales bacterium]|nr:hypothetical protein [Candidatus Limnocylindrales bacterium]
MPRTTIIRRRPTAEPPEMAAKDVTIELIDGVLTIKGEKEQDQMGVLTVHLPKAEEAKTKARPISILTK